MNISEIKNQIEKEYPYRTELHAHTSPASECSEVTPEEMVRIYNEKGYNAVVITNHFSLIPLGDKTIEEAVEIYIDDYNRAVKAAEGTELTVILGTEIRFANENYNDYLIYGVDADILKKCCEYFKDGVERFRKELELKDSIFVQAHPFRNNMERCNPQFLDGVEIMNMHPNHNGRNGIAVRYAYENKIHVKTIGSDFHHPNLGHEAVSALRTKQIPKDSFDLAKILRSGDYAFEIGENVIVLP